MFPIINDPAVIFGLFAESYRHLTPAIAITPEQKKLVNGIIEDVSRGHAISAFSTDVRFVLPPLNPATVRQTVPCSAFFAYFLQKLCDEMMEQKKNKVSPLRATELLYNLDHNSPEHDQPLLRLKRHGGGGFALVSSKEFTAQLGKKLCLWLNPMEATDWSLR